MTVARRSSVTARISAWLGKPKACHSRSRWLSDPAKAGERHHRNPPKKNPRPRQGSQTRNRTASPRHRAPPRQRATIPRPIFSYIRCVQCSRSGGRFQKNGFCRGTGEKKPTTCVVGFLNKAFYAGVTALAAGTQVALSNFVLIPQIVCKFAL
jgi:hypothetical protein